MLSLSLSLSLSFSLSSASIVQPRNWFLDWLERQSFSDVVSGEHSRTLALPISLYLSRTLKLFFIRTLLCDIFTACVDAAKRNVIKVRDCLTADKHEVAINAPKVNDSPRVH